MASFKVTFTLDEADANYFRSLYRQAKRGAKDLDADFGITAEAVAAKAKACLDAAKP